MHTTEFETFLNVLRSRPGLSVQAAARFASVPEVRACRAAKAAGLSTFKQRCEAAHRIMVPGGGLPVPQRPIHVKTPGQILHFDSCFVGYLATPGGVQAVTTWALVDRATGWAAAYVTLSDSPTNAATALGHVLAGLPFPIPANAVLCTDGREDMTDQSLDQLAAPYFRRFHAGRLGMNNPVEIFHGKVKQFLFREDPAGYQTVDDLQGALDRHVRLYNTHDEPKAHRIGCLAPAARLAALTGPGTFIQRLAAAAMIQSAHIRKPLTPLVIDPSGDSLFRAAPDIDPDSDQCVALLAPPRKLPVRLPDRNVVSGRTARPPGLYLAHR